MVEEIKKSLDKIEPEFESQQIADFDPHNGFSSRVLLLLIDVFLLEKKNGMVQKLNLFEKKHA